MNGPPATAVVRMTEGLHAILARHFPSGLDARELQALATRAVGCSAADADGAARAAKALARAERRAVTLADIANYTAAQPVIQIGEVKL